MATPASQLSIPAPGDADFVNGEFAVGTAAAAGTVTRFFSREFVAERSGLYLFKVWTAGFGVLRVGRDLGTLATILNTPPSFTIQTQIYLKKGVNRVDVETESSTAAFFAMLIYHPDEVVYASNSSGWVYENAAPPAEADVPSGEGAATSVFSILPNWATGITERLSYLTDLLTSETAAEQPRLIRMHPRRTFEAAFLRKGIVRARLDAFLLGIGRRAFWLPLWHEQYRHPSAIGPATAYAQFPAGTLALREFMVGDKVLVNNGDSGVYEALEVGSIDYDLDRMYWRASPALDWPLGTRIVPLRKARIVDQAQMTAPVDRVGRTSLRFELTEPEYRFGASWGHTSPVWQFKVNRAEDLVFSYDRNAYTMDNGAGPVDFTTPGNRALVTMRSGLTLRGRAGVIAFRRFIDMAGGRAGRFYMPTRMQDIVPVGDVIGGVNLDAQRAGFVEHVGSLQASRKIVSVVFNDGAPTVYRRVVDVQESLTYERFVLDSALPSIDVERIERIQFLVPSRFDQDTFEMTHLVDESVAVTTSVVTRSVDAGDMPDPD